MEKDGYPAVNTMLTADPPRHTKYRSLVDKAFTPKRVSDMGPAIEEKTNFIIDQFVEDKTYLLCKQTFREYLLLNHYLLDELLDHEPEHLISH